MMDVIDVRKTIMNFVGFTETTPDNNEQQHWIVEFDRLR